MFYSFDKATENRKQCSKCEVYFPENSNFFHRVDSILKWRGHSSQCKKCKGVATWKLSQERGGDEWRSGGVKYLPIRWNVDVVDTVPVFTTPSDLAKQEREKAIFETYNSLSESKEKQTLRKSFPFLSEASQ